MVALCYNSLGWGGRNLVFLRRDFFYRVGQMHSLHAFGLQGWQCGHGMCADAMWFFVDL